MPFEKNLRRLASRLPKKDIPSDLQERLLSSLPETHSLQKVPFDMKILLLPIFALVALTSGLLFTRVLVPGMRIFGMGSQSHTPRTPGLAVRLHFVDSSGKPVSDARVFLYDSRSPAQASRDELRSDAQGNFIVSDPQLDRFNVMGNHLYATGEITVPEGEQVVMLSEHPMHSITGRFVDAKGQPLMGAKPELFVVSSQTTQDLLTDPDGYFIAWVVPGNEYRISLAQPGYAPYFLNGIRLKQGESRDLGTITLR